jgi:decaprenylphospho-beta-D-erythro-pentofuranosid-2-ulose 2-reductase
MPSSAVVVGGGSDLATSVLIRLASFGLRTVVLGGPRLPSLERARGRLREAGISTIELVEFDITNVSDHRRFLDRAVAVVGELDLVVMAAGTLANERFEEQGGREISELLAATFSGPAAFIAEASSRLRAQNRGRLLVFTSVAGVRVRTGNLAYGAAKAGLDGFCQGVQDSLVRSGAQLIIVRPGFVHTKMTEGRRPAPFAVDADAVAVLVVDGISRGRTVVWAPRSLRVIFAMLLVLPRSLWRRIDR